MTKESGINKGKGNVTELEKENADAKDAKEFSKEIEDSKTVTKKKAVTKKTESTKKSSPTTKRTAKKKTTAKENVVVDGLNEKETAKDGKGNELAVASKKKGETKKTVSSKKSSSTTKKATAKKSPVKEKVVDNSLDLEENTKSVKTKEKDSAAETEEKKKTSTKKATSRKKTSSTAKKSTTKKSPVKEEVVDNSLDAEENTKSVKTKEKDSVAETEEKKKTSTKKATSRKKSSSTTKKATAKKPPTKEEVVENSLDAQENTKSAKTKEKDSVAETEEKKKTSTKKAASGKKGSSTAKKSTAKKTPTKEEVVENSLDAEENTKSVKTKEKDSVAETEEKKKTSTKKAASGKKASSTTKKATAKKPPTKEEVVENSLDAQENTKSAKTKEKDSVAETEEKKKTSTKKAASGKKGSSTAKKSTAKKTPTKEEVVENSLDAEENTKSVKTKEKDSVAETEEKKKTSTKKAASGKKGSSTTKKSTAKKTPVKEEVVENSLDAKEKSKVGKPPEKWGDKEKADTFGEKEATAVIETIKNIEKEPAAGDISSQGEKNSILEKDTIRIVKADIRKLYKKSRVSKSLRIVGLTILGIQCILSIGMAWLINSIGVFSIDFPIVVVTVSVLFSIIFGYIQFKTMKPGIIITMILSLIISVGFVGGITYAANAKSAIEEIAKSNKEISIEGNSELDLRTDIFTVLISGIGENQDVEGQISSDVNILAVVDPVNKDILLVETPREYYIAIPVKEGNGMDKISNSMIYGIDSTMAGIEKLYEVDIDFYVATDMVALKEVVDAIGGVSINPETTFNGQEALDYSYNTNVVGIPQEILVSAIIEKLKSPFGLVYGGEVMNIIEEHGSTNLSEEQIYQLIEYRPAEENYWQIRTKTASGLWKEEQCYSVPGKELLVLDPYAPDIVGIKSQINDILNSTEVK